MKYLKIFETFGDYYSEISSHGYADRGDNVEEISENEFFKIKNKIKSKGTLLFSIIMDKDFKSMCKVKIDEEDDFLYRYFILTKMSDEWYYIFLRESPRGGEVRNKYYKADQLEGLEKFIDEVL